MDVDRGWFCQFLEPDLKTSLPRKLTFKEPGKVREMYDRFGLEKGLADQQALEYGINQGRGSIWLSLTNDQYNKLKRWDPMAEKIRFTKQYKPMGFGDRDDHGSVEAHLKAKEHAKQMRELYKRMNELGP
jgi:hypothetical protein